MSLNFFLKTNGVPCTKKLCVQNFIQDVLIRGENFFFERGSCVMSYVQHSFIRATWYRILFYSDGAFI